MLPTIAVLYFHHCTDALTRYHYEVLLSQNAGDAGVTIVPICFPEYAAQVLPGTYVPEHLAEFRWNRGTIFQRFSHGGKPVLSDLDCLIWDWVLFSGQQADRIILAEGDMLSRCSMREFYGPSFQYELTGSVVRSGISANKDWPWYQWASPLALADFGTRVTSITPVCGMQFSWDLALKIANQARSRPGAYDDVHVEMAIPSLARKFGVEARQTIVPIGHLAKEYIDYVPAAR